MGVQILFPHILGMTLTASMVTLLVLVARLLLKHAPRLFSYVLWAAVLFRLLCPVSFSSEWSLFGLMKPHANETQDWSGELIDLTSKPFFDGLGRPVTQPAVPDSVQPTAPDNENPTVTPQIPGISQPDTDVQRSLPTLEDCLPYLWAIGATVMLLHGIGHYLRLRKRLTGSIKMEENVYWTDCSGAPFVIGIFRPRIYLPATLSENELPYILAHEQHHIQRLDHVVKLLAWIALCIHWFNPLVWVAFILAGRDMEMSCDEAVIGKLGPGIRADYSASLLNSVVGHRIFTNTPLSFGGNDTIGRIRNMAKWKKPKKWAKALCWPLCILFLTACVANPKLEMSGSEGPTPNPAASVNTEDNGPTLDISDHSGGSIQTVNKIYPNEFFPFTQIPEDLYKITARDADVISLEEQAAAAQYLGCVFGCTPLIDQGKYWEEWKTVYYSTPDGGTICYDGNGILYADPGATPCSVREAQGEVERVAVIDVSIGEDPNITYALGGRDYSVADAVAYAESLWDRHLRPYTLCDDVKVGSVIVYREQDGTCKYVLLLDKYVAGLAVEQYSSNTHTFAHHEGFLPSFILVEMDAPDHIYFYQDFGGFEIKDLERVELPMDAETAAVEAGRVLAESVGSGVREMTLKYCFFAQEISAENDKGRTYIGYPYWCLVLEWGDEGGYAPDNYRPNKTLYIDPFTGTGYMTDTMNGNPLRYYT